MSGAVTPADARRMWQLFEPVHAVVYFAPQARAAFEAVGLRGFWRGYFAMRAAPLGPIPGGTLARGAAQRSGRVRRHARPGRLTSR